MPFEIVKKDITTMQVDAIVNAANKTLLGGGGVDGAIHEAAGKKLFEECKNLGGCEVGEAKITLGYNLPAKYVIHTVGPIYSGGSFGEAQMLESCYRNSLNLAKTRGVESIAFPLISAGAYGYPKDEALRIASSTITAFLAENDMYVYLTIYGEDSFSSYPDLTDEIDSYLRTNLEAEFSQNYRAKFLCGGTVPPPLMYNVSDAAFEAPKRVVSDEKCKSENADLTNLLKNLDESFSEMLLRKIDELGMTDSECYKKANIDRKHFSKIRSNKNYRPKKQTAIAFAIALELDLNETESLLKKAGFALSKSSEFDVIIEFFISNGIYDIHKINELLFYYDQSLLGA